MVTIDVPICVMLGSAVALRHTPAAETSEAGTAALRLRALALVTFGFAPLGQLFELYHRDWQWQYFVAVLPPYASMLFVVAMSAGGLMGYELSARALRAGNKTAAWAVMLGAAGFTSLYSLVFWRRVLWVGTRAEWNAGTATLMFEHREFMGLLVGCGLWLTGVVLVGLKGGRTARAPLAQSRASAN